MVSTDKLSAGKNQLGHKLPTPVVTDGHFKSIIIFYYRHWQTFFLPFRRGNFHDSNLKRIKDPQINNIMWGGLD